jgi:hypothetical protein
VPVEAVIGWPPVGKRGTEIEAMQDSLQLAVGGPMNGNEVLKIRIPPEIKLQAKTIADREFLSEGGVAEALGYPRD